MGEVYLGEQVSLGRKVAIKVLHHDLHAQAGMAERFKREARLLSAVEHPAVVRIVDFGESGDHACLVMEFVEGESLYDVLTPGPMPPGRALPLLQQLAEGLAAIHDKSIIHRDLKPENVFISKSARGEQARLLDFGIARLVEPDAASSVSQIGVVLGTPEYLSPEQAVGAKVDTRSDLYSFGVLTYRVLSGRLPFDGPLPRNFLSQHASAAPLPLDRAAPTLSRYVGLLSLVMRLLEKDPGKRPQSAHELADALAAAHSALSAFTPGLGTPAYVPPPGNGATPSSGTAVFGAGGPTGSSAGPTGTAAFAGGAPAPQPGSGTAAFGVASSGGSASGAVPVASPRTGTAAFGMKPSGSMAAVTGGGASVVKPQNLTVMLTDIQGFTERTSRQTHEENARMLETHDKLLMPLVKEHDGRLVQKRGDALLVVFRSPTSAVLCGMAMQDRLWRHNQTVPELDRLNVRVCLHAGEVLATTDTVLGEPMEVVEAVEHVASAGEVTFTEAVNLARNRAEVTAEPCGTIALPGRDEQLQLYRCERAAEGPPFGDRFASQGGRAGALAPLLAKLQTVKLPTGWGELLRHRRREAALVAGAVVLLAAGAAWLGQRNDAGARAFALLEDGKLDEALALMDGATDEEKALPSLRRARVAAHHSKGHHISERTALNHLKEEELEDLEPLILDGLAEDYGKEQLTVLERSLARIPKDRVRAHYEDLAEEAYSLRQWGALRYLEFAKAADGVDLVRAYSEALNASDCDIRTQAANRLAGLGDADAIPALERVTGLPREKGVFGSKDCGHEAAAAAIKSLKKKHD
ncbi:protein kinase domain-containing protein [Corallococcus macrosporus]|uniref:Serine/threonine protein kinase Pkn2 n=1 Tax=Myxococcus fulvus (strain ATCC BAA-855 / HW-1) TaxID=483219 RepID=F8CEC6_MYXFH|nr:protein kinase [Corallococcus macrosporus]AEI64796.1 serine/threonine protein kinase Pkn2 [Corallococcus macrosporus]